MIASPQDSKIDAACSVTSVAPISSDFATRRLMFTAPNTRTDPATDRDLPLSSSARMHSSRGVGFMCINQLSTSHQERRRTESPLLPRAARHAGSAVAFCVPRSAGKQLGRLGQSTCTNCKHGPGCRRQSVRDRCPACTRPCSHPYRPGLARRSQAGAWTAYGRRTEIQRNEPGRKSREQRACHSIGNDRGEQG